MWHKCADKCLSLEPLDEPARISFLRMYLNLASKKLNEEQEFIIAGTPHAGTIPISQHLSLTLTGNPRYLKTLIEDINVWGEFEELTSKIKKDLRAQNASELYEIVLSRLEADYDSGKQIIQNFLSLL